MIDQIQWLGHGSFSIQGPPLIYINPWRVVRSTFHPDVILVSHDHYEHCSIADIHKLRGSQTRVIGNENVSRQIDDCLILRPWQSITIDRASIKGVPAYAPDDLHHPIEAGGLGFVISLNYHDIYYAGDTRHIPEMDFIRPDIAIMPIDGNGTMTISEATEVIKKMRPRWTIPSNWGALAGGATMVDAQNFKDAVSGWSEVVILPQSR